MNTKPDEQQEGTLCVTPQWGDIPSMMKYLGQQWVRPHPDRTIIPEEWIQCMTAQGRIVLCDVWSPLSGMGAFYEPLTWDTLPIMGEEVAK